jgi:hypothetical protein
MFLLLTILILVLAFGYLMGVSYTIKLIEKKEKKEKKEL